MKRWTKKQFVDSVNPCGYRMKIWWFFLWHRYITLLDILNCDDIPAHNRVLAVFYLDLDLYRTFRDPGSEYTEWIMQMRAELTGEEG